jgi:hypothetical protein
MLPQLGGYVIDKGDPLYSVWAMAWQAHSLTTDPLHFYDANIMYPFKGTLAFLAFYVGRLGFLDGRAGFHYAVAKASYYWQIRVKQIEIERAER